MDYSDSADTLLDFRDWFTSRVFFFKQALFRPSALATYRNLMKNQHLSRPELAELNWRRRKGIIEHAYSHVAYYREAFRNAGFHPEQLRSPDDWSRVPLLTRADLAGNYDRLVADNADRRRVVAVATGGSTGQPVKVLRDLRYPSETLFWRMMSWWKLAPGIPSAHSWRLLRKTRLSRLRNRALWWPTRRLWLDAAELSLANLSGFVVQFNRAKPRFLHGYVGAIQELAEYCERNGVAVHSPAAVWLTASPISAVVRALIERVFHAPVYDQYGSCEIFALAAECQLHTGLHIFSDAVHVEFINDEGDPSEPETPGRIIVTDLENRAFPLIRYENGDIGSALSSPCGCGLQFPLMRPVKGRVSDRIRLPDGTTVSGEYATTLFDAFPEAVTSFQILQSADYSVLIRVVPNNACPASAEAIDAVMRHVSAMVKQQVPVAVSRVPSIESNQGKLRFVVSEVNRSAFSS